MIWIYELDGSAKLTRVATSTYGAEFTGTSWYEINDFGYMTTVQQVPPPPSSPLTATCGPSQSPEPFIGRNIDVIYLFPCAHASLCAPVRVTHIASQDLPFPCCTVPPPE